MPIFDNSCRECYNYLIARTCLAFPDTIPDRIWNGENDHHNPYSGDHGIQFEPLEEEPSDDE